MVEDTCRICRGEGTAETPLLFPCKCRGSIKYIHQDCLLEWLEHSGRKESKCDICNTSYVFKTIYKDTIPDTIPLKYIVSKSFNLIVSLVYKTLVFGCYFSFLIVGIPIYWKFISRIYTWFIDNSLPPNKNFLEALFYGELDLDVHNSDWPTLFMKFFSYSYVSGFTYISIFIVVHIALFLEHEWVTRDEGFTKLLAKKIGEAKKSTLLDLIKKNIQSYENGENSDLALENLIDFANFLKNSDDKDEELNMELRNLFIFINEAHINRGSFTNPIEEMEDLNIDAHDNNSIQNHEWADQIDDDDLEDDFNDEDELNRQDSNEEQEFNTQASIESFPPSQQQREQHEQDLVERPDVPTLPYTQGTDRVQIQPRFPLAFENNFNNLESNDSVEGDEDDEGDDNDDDEEYEEEDEDGEIEDNGESDHENEEREIPDIPVPMPPPVPQNAGDLEDENIGILNAFGLGLNFDTPIKVSLLVNLVLTVYLFLFYLMPSMIGVVLIKFTFPLIELFTRYTFGKIQISEDIKPDFESMFGTIFNTFYNLKITQLPPTVTERVLILSIGYGSIGYGMKKFMDLLSHNCSKTNPLMGKSRDYYYVLHEVKYTLKVFLVFAIELFVFPTYCGLLLDFCFCPIVKFKQDFSLSFENFSSIQFVDPNSLIRIILYWASGTLYMCMFALFVGMTRSLILRPGVLFFIRSPEDPNARLIHDALVKPLSLQLSRIGLSVVIYTCFILIGIGGLTYGLKIALWDLFPIITPTGIQSIFLWNFFSISVFRAIELVKKYVRLYYMRSFKICCHKLRLSSFILGIDQPTERGYVLYRSWFQFLLGGKPDYSSPTSYEDGVALMKEDPQVKCVFVPDGSFYRVPDNDAVSRKFLKQLFVPVTKNDQLLNSTNQINPQINSNPNNDDSDSDSDIIVNNSYTVVYRPPLFQYRILGLLLMLWVFAGLLIVSFGLLAFFVGKMASTPLNILLRKVGLTVNEYGKNIDASSVVIGLEIELIGLHLYDHLCMNRYSFESLNNAVNFRMIREHFVTMLNGFIWSLSQILSISYVLSVHYYGVQVTYVYYHTNKVLNEFTFDISPKLIFYHLILSLFTLVPLLTGVFFTMKNYNTQIMTTFRDAVHLHLLPVVSKIVLLFTTIVVSLIFYAITNSLMSGSSPRVIEIVQQTCFGGLPKSWYIYSFLPSVLLQCVYVAGVTIRKYIRFINEEIKIEKFSIGKQLENFEIENESNEY